MAPRLWKDVFSTEGLKSYKALIQDRDGKVSSFLEFDPLRWKSAADNQPAHSVLNGIPYGSKDNIAVRSFHLTCGSKMLKNFVSPYSATCVERLASSGAVPVGKLNLDEFGMGSSCDNSAFKKTNNPWDLERVAGGSSGGSAAAVAAGLLPLALGSDTGGSIRQPASFCGTYGLKPTYGAVSRYGLVAYASSLEVVGAVAKDLSLLEAAFAAMRGKDERDQTTIDPADFASPARSRNRVGVLNIADGVLDARVSKAMREYKAALTSQGFELVEISLKMLDFCVAAYYTIASAEASANLARFNGIRYGERPVYSENPDSLVRQSRDEGFGPEVKLRVILGTYVLRSGFQDQYYQRAQKIRTALRNEIDAAFESLDAILLPCFPTAAFKHGAAELDPFQQKNADIFTTLANLSGNPALTVPGPVLDGLPVGMQLMGAPLAESKLFDIARKIATHFPAVSPPGFDDVYSLS